MAKDKFKKFDQKDHEALKQKALEALAKTEEFLAFTLSEDKKSLAAGVSCSDTFLKGAIQIIQHNFPALFAEALMEIMVNDISRVEAALNKDKLN